MSLLPSEYTQHEPSGARVRILIVDDDRSLVRAVSRFLSEEYELSSCDCGRAAIERVRSGARPDVILSDVLLPDILGPELYDAITAVAPELGGRFVFMSGMSGAPPALDAIHAACVCKPFAIAELRAAIGAVLQRAAS